MSASSKRKPLGTMQDALEESARRNETMEAELIRRAEEEDDNRKRHNATRRAELHTTFEQRRQANRDSAHRTAEIHESDMRSFRQYVDTNADVDRRVEGRKQAEAQQRHDAAAATTLDALDEVEGTLRRLGIDSGDGGTTGGGGTTGAGGPRGGAKGGPLSKTAIVGRRSSASGGSTTVPSSVPSGAGTVKAGATVSFATTTTIALAPLPPTVDHPASNDEYVSRIHERQQQHVTARADRLKRQLKIEEDLRKAAEELQVKRALEEAVNRGRALLDAARAPAVSMACAQHRERALARIAAESIAAQSAVIATSMIEEEPRIAQQAAETRKKTTAAFVTAREAVKAQETAFEAAQRAEGTRFAAALVEGIANLAVAVHDINVPRKQRSIVRQLSDPVGVTEWRQLVDEHLNLNRLAAIEAVQIARNTTAATSPTRRKRGLTKTVAGAGGNASMVGPGSFAVAAASMSGSQLQATLGATTAVGPKVEIVAPDTPGGKPSGGGAPHQQTAGGGARPSTGTTPALGSPLAVRSLTGDASLDPFVNDYVERFMGDLSALDTKRTLGRVGHILKNAFQQQLNATAAAPPPASTSTGSVAPPTHHRRQSSLSDKPQPQAAGAPLTANGPSVWFALGDVTTGVWSLALDTDNEVARQKIANQDTSVPAAPPTLSTDPAVAAMQLPAPRRTTVIGKRRTVAIGEGVSKTVEVWTPAALVEEHDAYERAVAKRQATLAAAAAAAATEGGGKAASAGKGGQGAAPAGAGSSKAGGKAAAAADAATDEKPVPPSVAALLVGALSRRVLHSLEAAAPPAAPMSAAPSKANVHRQSVVAPGGGSSAPLTPRGGGVVHVEEPPLPPPADVVLLAGFDTRDAAFVDDFLRALEAAIDSGTPMALGVVTAKGETCAGIVAARHHRQQRKAVESLGGGPMTAKALAAFDATVGTSLISDAAFHDRVVAAMTKGHVPALFDALQVAGSSARGHTTAFPPASDDAASFWHRLESLLDEQEIDAPSVASPPPPGPTAASTAAAPPPTVGHRLVAGVSTRNVLLQDVDCFGRTPLPMFAELIAKALVGSVDAAGRSSYFAGSASTRPGRSSVPPPPSAGAALPADRHRPDNLVAALIDALLSDPVFEPVVVDAAKHNAVKAPSAEASVLSGTYEAIDEAHRELREFELDVVSNVALAADRAITELRRPWFHEDIEASFDANATLGTDAFDATQRTTGARGGLHSRPEFRPPSLAPSQDRTRGNTPAVDRPSTSASHGLASRGKSDHGEALQQFALLNQAQRWQVCDTRRTELNTRLGLALAEVTAPGTAAVGSRMSAAAAILYHVACLVSDLGYIAGGGTGGLNAGQAINIKQMGFGSVAQGGFLPPPPDAESCDGWLTRVLGEESVALTALSGTQPAFDVSPIAGAILTDIAEQLKDGAASMGVPWPLELSSAWTTIVSFVVEDFKRTLRFEFGEVKELCTAVRMWSDTLYSDYARAGEGLATASGGVDDVKKQSFERLRSINRPRSADELLLMAPCPDIVKTANWREGTWETLLQDTGSHVAMNAGGVGGVIMGGLAPPPARGVLEFAALPKPDDASSPAAGGYRFWPSHARYLAHHVAATRTHDQAAVATHGVEWRLPAQTAHALLAAQLASLAEWGLTQRAPPAYLSHPAAAYAVSRQWFAGAPATARKTLAAQLQAKKDAAAAAAAMAASQSKPQPSPLLGSGSRPPSQLAGEQLAAAPNGKPAALRPGSRVSGPAARHQSMSRRPSQALVEPPTAAVLAAAAGVSSAHATPPAAPDAAAVKAEEDEAKREAAFVDVENTCAWRSLHRLLRSLDAIAVATDLDPATPKAVDVGQLFITLALGRCGTAAPVVTTTGGDASASRGRSTLVGPESATITQRAAIARRVGALLSSPAVTNVSPLAHLPQHPDPVLSTAHSTVRDYTAFAALPVWEEWIRDAASRQIFCRALWEFFALASSGAEEPNATSVGAQAALPQLAVGGNSQPGSPKSTTGASEQPTTTPSTTPRTTASKPSTGGRLSVLTLLNALCSAESSMKALELRFWFFTGWLGGAAAQDSAVMRPLWNAALLETLPTIAAADLEAAVLVSHPPPAAAATPSSTGASAASVFVPVVVKELRRVTLQQCTSLWGCEVWRHRVNASKAPSRGNDVAVAHRTVLWQ